MTTKQEVLEKLENVQNNYILGLAAMSLFAEPSVREHLRRSHVAFCNYKIPFDQVAGLLKEYDLKILPISWNVRTMSAELDNKPLEIDFLGYDGSWDLFQEIKHFVLGH
jgi:hypothetical protein